MKSNLARGREKVIKELPAWDVILRGTLMRYRRTCGNRGCRCYLNRGLRHGPYWYLAVRWAKGRQKLYAIAPALVPRVRRGVAAYHALWRNLYRVAQLNLEILLSEQRRGR